MNGYKKMKMLQRMKLVKIISTVTAMAMAVTSLVVAASANEADRDVIEKALGNLTDYGIVADTFSAKLDFEANFAVNNLELYTSFGSGNYVNRASRTIRFSISTEIADSNQTYYYGIFTKDGTLIDVKYVSSDKDSGSDDAQVKVLEVNFDGKGTKDFVVTIPAGSEYVYKDLIVHELRKNDSLGQYETVDSGYLLPAGASDKTDLQSQVYNCIVSSTLATDGNARFQYGKTVYIGTELGKRIWQSKSNGKPYRWHYNEDLPPEKHYVSTHDEWIDGYWDAENNVYVQGYVETVTDLDENGDPIMITTYPIDIAYCDHDEGSSDPSSQFIVMANSEKYGVEAKTYVDNMLATIKTASETIAKFDTTSANSKVILHNIEGSILQDSELDKKLSADYDWLREHPDYIMVVNVKMSSVGATVAFGHGINDLYDADTASRVIYNFIGGTSPDKTTVYIGNMFGGTVIAPNATVINNASVIGAVYAPVVKQGNGEFHVSSYRYGPLDDSYSSNHYPSPETTTTTTEETTTTTTTTDGSTTTTTEPDDTTTTTATDPEDTTTTTEEITTTTIVSEETTTTTTVEETTTTTPPPTTTTTTTTTTSQTTTTPPPTTTITTPQTTTTTTTPTTTTTTPQTTTATTPPTTTTPQTTTTATPPTTSTTPQTTTTPVTTITTPASTTTPQTTTAASTPATTTSTSVTTTTTPAETATTTTTTDVTTTVSEEQETTEPEVTSSEEVTTSEEVTSEEVTTGEEIEATTTEETAVPPTDTTVPSDTTVPPVTTDEDLIEIPEEDIPLITIPFDDIPLDQLIIIDEDIPLGDLPLNTGINNSMMMFIIIGGAALTIGVGAQICTVVLKKKSNA